MPHHGHRSRSRWRRPGLRPRRQSPLPVRRVVRAAKPRRHEAALSAGVRSLTRSARARLSQPPAQRAGATVRLPMSIAHESCCSRLASTTRLISSTPSSPSRWASNSSKAATSSCKGHRLHAHDDGLRARRRHLPPHRRRFHRSEGLSHRLDARRPRHRWTSIAAGASRSPTPRAPASPTTRSIYAYVAEDDQVLPGRRGDPAQRADLRLPRRRRHASTCSPTSTNSW